MAASSADSTARVGQALRERVRGEVVLDEQGRGRYATDQSIYRVLPAAVVVPRVTEDVVAAVRTARNEGLALTARGGGSGTAGAALGRGIVAAFPRRGPLNRIVEFQDADGGPQVTVQPSVVHDDLQAFLRERGLFLPADPSSGAISVLGGNVATKASGPTPSSTAPSTATSSTSSSSPRTAVSWTPPTRTPCPSASVTASVGSATTCWPTPRPSTASRPADTSRPPAATTCSPVSASRPSAASWPSSWSAA
ncbi:MAG: FAD-binding oxidoreductase [Planctomycetota bacterium]